MNRIELNRETPDFFHFIVTWCGVSHRSGALLYTTVRIKNKFTNSTSCKGTYVAKRCVSFIDKITNREITVRDKHQIVSNC